MLGKEYRPPLHLGVVAIEKGSLRVPLNYGRQLYGWFDFGVNFLLDWLPYQKLKKKP